ncbi:unnamed protein product [Phaeothamnion confervicola]
MMRRLQPFLARCSRDEVVQLAIFFHDVVYNPTSASNEEDSVLLYRAFAEEAGLAPDDVEQVSGFIMATKAHAYSGEDWDLKLFLDLDMAVLGRKRDGYEEYARQIRAEYKHLPLGTYLRERARVLGNMLAADRIFATDGFAAQLEAAARANMASEIDCLGRGCIPGLPEGEDVGSLAAAAGLGRFSGFGGGSSSGGESDGGGGGGDGGGFGGCCGGGVTPPVVHFSDGSAPGDAIVADLTRIERDRKMASAHPETAVTRWPDAPAVQFADGSHPGDNIKADLLHSHSFAEEAKTHWPAMGALPDDAAAVAAAAAAAAAADEAGDDEAVETVVAAAAAVGATMPRGREADTAGKEEALRPEKKCRLMSDD